MRIVFDTNVLIAALISRGVCADLLEHCVQKHTIVASEHILGELHRHLTGKFKYSREDADDSVTLLRSVAVIVSPAVFDHRICRDADDDLILGTAVAGQAKCIVTGDNDLLVLERHDEIPILRPGDFSKFES